MSKGDLTTVSESEKGSRTLIASSLIHRKQTHGPEHVVVHDSPREALSTGKVIDGFISVWFGVVGLTDGICKSTSEENKESAFGQICKDRRISIEASSGGL
ncbi:hypothetical protein Tco_0999037 [Tanacetum coccineum]